MQVDYSKFGNEVIKLALSESDKLLSDTISSFHRINDKCYAAVAIYSATLSFYGSKLISEQNAESLIISIGSLMSIMLLITNLFPGKMSSRGAKPSFFLNHYWYDISEQERNIAILLLEERENDIDQNKKEISKRNKQFKHAAYLFLGSILIALFRSWWIGKLLPLIACFRFIN